MSEETRENCLTHAKCLLNKLKHKEAEMLWYSSNEKIFEQDQKVNKWLCKDLTHVPKVMQTKFPASVMVLGLVRIKEMPFILIFFLKA